MISKPTTPQLIDAACTELETKIAPAVADPATKIVVGARRDASCGSRAVLERLAAAVKPPPEPRADQIVSPSRERRIDPRQSPRA